MAVSQSADVPVVARTEATVPQELSEESGVVSRWARKDPVQAVAILLIVASLVWRAEIASRGYLNQDDFMFSSIAAESGFSPHFLLSNYNNGHLMPGVLIMFWLVVRATGLAYWPYVLILIAGQTVLGVMFFRLLRQLIPPGWALLIPLSVVLFSPLSLDTTSFWTTGALILPLEIALVWAIGAQVRYVRTRQPKHLVSLGLALIFGLFFFEKSLLIAPLVFFLTACWFVEGGALRSVWRAGYRYWQSWAVLGGISAAYLGIFERTAPSTAKPSSVGEVVDFFRELVGATLIPGLFGGPWRWLGLDDSAPAALPTDLTRWLSWALLLGLVIGSMLLNPRAGRSWALLGLYTGLVTALFAWTRLGTPVGAMVGLFTRYVADIVVIAALCLGVALFGLVEDGATASGRHRRGLAQWRAFATPILLVATVLGVGTAWSAAQFGDLWAVKSGRDYLRTAQADLAKAKPGTVFFDQRVPDKVVWSLLAPYNMQSHFFRPISPRPVFVTETENPSMFDNSGHIHPAWVEGPTTLPGPDTSCGHKINGGQTVRIPLNKSIYDWFWAVRVGYLSGFDTTATLRLGEGTTKFHIRRAVTNDFFLIEGGGDAVEVTIDNPAATVCIWDVSVGPVGVRPSNNTG